MEYKNMSDNNYDQSNNWMNGAGYDQNYNQMNEAGYDQGYNQMNGAGYDQNYNQMNGAGYDQGYNQMNNAGYGQNYNQVMSYGNVVKRKYVHPSMVAGIISVILLMAGIISPVIDFSVFNENVHIQYNLFKICKNVGLISPMWNGIPYGMIAGIIAMAVLSFVKIPALKLVPCMIIIAMLILMLLDLGNVVDWIKGILEKYYEDGAVMTSVTFDIRCIMHGAYLVAAGLLTGFVSCFLSAE